MERKCILSIDGLKITYDAKKAPVCAVRGVNLTLLENEDIGIMGESGCGKSTLAMQILRLLDDKASAEGRIVYNGKDLCRLTDRQMNAIRWDKIAISFQNALEVLNPVMTVGGQIAEAVKWHKKLTEKELSDKIGTLLDMVQLDRKWDKAYPHELSGGMRQKVLLAMALACEPEILILDEPTTALDVENKKNIIDLILRLKKEKGFSLITISHDVEVISRLSKRLYVMYGGYFVESGPTREVLEEPYHTYTRGFLNASPVFFQYKDLWGIRSRLENKDTIEDSCPFAARCPQGTPECRPVPVMAEAGPGRFVACHKGGIETLMKVNGLRKTFKTHTDTVLAVNGVSVEIKSGEVIALIGKSGSGKSTLAQLMVALTAPETGEVLYRGDKVRGNWVTRMQQGVQIVMQDPISATNSHMRIADVVAEPLTINRIGTAAENRDKVVRLLEMVQLPYDDAFLNRKCAGLSGGQRQRLSIARALTMNPRVLIADEITSMLDPSTQANLMRELKDIQNRYGFTMIFITHDLYMARKVADRVFVMHEGKIVETGMASSIFDSPVSPVTRRLFDEFRCGNLLYN